MWKATVGLKPAVPPKPNADDDWETDPDFINDISEKESRWGARTVTGSGHQESIRLDQLREEVLKSDRELKEKQDMPKPSLGYGGSFGIETGRQDKSAVGWEHNEKTVPHASQKDYKHGFGGSNGIETGRQDKSAVGWEHNEKAVPHASQKDYKHGFGGAFGLTQNMDKSAVGWEEQSKPSVHESQKDYKHGFGGAHGLIKNMDKSAVGWDEKPEKSAPTKVAHDIPQANASGLRNKFEQMASQQQNDNDRVQQEREKRKREDEELKRRETEKTKQQNVDIPASHKVVKENVPQANASGLRNKFEQMAVQQQNDNDKVQQEREKRKREDEELKCRNEETERVRQQRIDEQHAQMPDVESHEDRHQHYVESTSPQPPSSSRNRTSLGVRLPIAPPSVESSHQEYVPASLPEPGLYEEPPAEPEPEASRVQVLPPSNNLPFRGALPRRQSSTTDDEKGDDADWNETSVPTVFKLPAASNFPEEPTEPTPTIHVSNNNTVFSASPPQQIPTYDFVPEAPTQSQSHSSSTRTPAADKYDYVPDEPPAMMAAFGVSHEMYNEPPVSHEPPAMMAAFGVSHDLYEEPPIDNEPPPAPQSASLSAIALYEYEKQDDDEISFDVNDLITDIEQIDAGWWRGFCHGKFGLFPSNYVQLQ